MDKVLAFYHTWLVPFFATAAFGLTLWREWRERTVVEIRREGSRLVVVNHSRFPVYLDRVGRIDGEFHAVIVGIDAVLSGSDNHGKIERGASWQCSMTLRGELDAGWAGETVGWWARTARDQVFTSFPWWRIDQRLRFRLTRRRHAVP